jgi:hypothetical protein
MREDKSVNAMNSYGVDKNWYVDFGATDHITRELDKLAVRDTYNGNDQIYTASGSSMRIEHIGKSMICTPYCDLVLNHFLHSPQASKNIASVHRFPSDDNAFFKLHPDFFFLLRIELWKTLLQGKSRGGMYPIPCNSTTTTSVRQVLSLKKIPITRWHARLGHLSSSVVRFVLSKNSLPFISENSQESICDVFQQAKSHQLSYPMSSSISNAPL